MELVQGCLHRSKSPAAAGGLERWPMGLESHYGERILPIPAAIADAWCGCRWAAFAIEGRPNRSDGAGASADGGGAECGGFRALGCGHDRSVWLSPSRAGGG